MSYILLLAFLAGGSVHHEVMRCPDWECVQEILDAAPSSTQLMRIRIYDREPEILPGKATVFPPRLDLWYR